MVSERLRGLVWSSAYDDDDEDDGVKDKKKHVNYCQSAVDLQETVYFITKNGASGHVIRSIFLNEKVKIF